MSAHGTTTRNDPRNPVLGFEIEEEDLSDEIPEDWDPEIHLS